MSRPVCQDSAAAVADTIQAGRWVWPACHVHPVCPPWWDSPDGPRSTHHTADAISSRGEDGGLPGTGLGHRQPLVPAARLTPISPCLAGLEFWSWLWLWGSLRPARPCWALVCTSGVPRLNLAQLLESLRGVCRAIPQAKDVGNGQKPSPAGWAEWLPCNRLGNVSESGRQMVILHGARSPKLHKRRATLFPPGG